MKKAVYWTIAVIVLVFVSFLIFIQYRSAKAYGIALHQKANAILQVNIDKIFLQIAFNFVKNPSYYLKGKPDKSPGNGQENHGLSLPSHLFLYTIKGMKDDTFFGTIPIDDLETLKAFLNRELKNSPFKKGEANIETSTALKGKLTFAYLHDQLAFAFSNTQENVTGILSDLLLKRNLLSQKEQETKLMRSAAHHVMYQSQYASVHLDFEDGKIKIGGLLDSLKEADHLANLPNFNQGSAVQFYANLNLAPFLKQKQYQIGDFTLATDTLLKYHHGLTAFELLKTTTQSDTLITYEYNDDFEKVEKQTIKRVQIPEMSLFLSGDGIGLSNYLKRQNILTDRDSLNKQFFPLYTVYVSTSPNDLTLSTSKAFKKVVPQKKQKNLLWLKIDLDKVKKLDEFAIFSHQLASLGGIELSLVPTGKKLRLDGTFQMKNNQINSLVQLK
jgi:hypothetical protein